LLNCFPVAEWRERRRNNCRSVSAVLKGLPWLKVLEADGDGGTCQYSGIVLFDSEERRDFVRQKLRDRRMFLPVLWELEHAALPGIPEEHRRFSKTLLCIPCDARYDQATVEKVAGLIRDIG
jgi:dTDP-4-amino-4,6-dideoxygalactose transaminase